MSRSSGGYDVIVAGLGAVGSATAYHLARQGRPVLGLERYTVPNQMGSSHGHSRIIRFAYFEDPSYVPLAQRAAELWRELERESGDQLFLVTGSLDIGESQSQVVRGSLEACRVHGLEHEVMTGVEASGRFPALELGPELVAVLQPEGGALRPEACIAAQARLAEAAGAELRTGERVLSWAATPAGVRVLSDRAGYDASALVITAGSWAPDLLPFLEGLAVPERQVLGWFETTPRELFDPARLPVLVAEVEGGVYYGLPEIEVPGFKLGRFHHLGQAGHPDQLDRQVHPEDEATLRAFTRRYVPAAQGPLLSSTVCLFTNSPDQHFILDRHPAHEQVSFFAGCSGHAFKFASALGETLASMATGGRPAYDNPLFRLDRFGSGRELAGRA